MGGINWRSVLMSGILAGLAWSLMTLPILILFGGEIIDAVPRPLVTAGRLGSFSLNVLAGVWAMWLYAVLRPLYGPGPKAAAIAGFSWWMVATINTWQWTEIGLLRFKGLVPLIAASLPILVAVTTFGAWLYQDKAPVIGDQ
ncbi:MAG TPA: hypothetical protein VFZ31_13830 [Vicinamibacterales bacterium]